MGNPTWVPPIVHDHRTLSQERTSFPFCRCLDLLKSVNTPFGKNLKSRHVRNSRVPYPTLITASASSFPPLNASAALRASAAGPIGRLQRSSAGLPLQAGPGLQRPRPGERAGGSAPSAGAGCWGPRGGGGEPGLFWSLWPSPAKLAADVLPEHSRKSIGTSLTGTKHRQRSGFDLQQVNPLSLSGTRGVRSSGSCSQPLGRVSLGIAHSRALAGTHCPLRPSPARARRA